MATRETNLALTERGYELFAKGDFDGMRELFTDDIVWHTAGVSIFELEYKGMDALFGYFTKLFELSDGTFKAEPLYLLGDDHDHVMVMQHTAGSHAGKLVDTTLVMVFDIRGEKVYRVTEFASEPTKLEAFWA